jgi:hypothetical protein
MPKPTVPPGSIVKALKEFDSFDFTQTSATTFKLSASQDGGTTVLGTATILDLKETPGNETVFDVSSVPGTEDFVISADLTQQLTHLADLF